MRNESKQAEDAMLCPSCLGKLPGEPGQVVKCRHCGSDIHWCDDGKPYKTKLAGAKPVVKEVDPRFLLPPNVPATVSENESSVSKVKEAEDISFLTRAAIAEEYFQEGHKGLREITEEVARASVKIANGCWPGLTSMNEIIAKIVVNGTNPAFKLNLDGLTSITKDVAVELAKFQGNYLQLNGLNSIMKDVAEELVKFAGTFLQLNGLTLITKDVAKELMKGRGGIGSHVFFNAESWSIDLNGLTSMSHEVACELANFNGGEIGLRGLPSITREVAYELRNFQGQSLVLSAECVCCDKEVSEILSKISAVSAPYLFWEDVT